MNVKKIALCMLLVFLVAGVVFAQESRAVDGVIVRAIVGGFEIRNTNSHLVNVTIHVGGPQRPGGVARWENFGTVALGPGETGRLTRQSWVNGNATPRNIQNTVGVTVSR